MKQAAMMGVAAAVLMSVGLGAQGRNFGGTWTIDAEKTMAAGGGAVLGARSGGGGGGGSRSGGGGDVTTGAVAVAGGRGGGGGGMRSGGPGGTPGMALTVDATSFTMTQGTTTTVYKLDGSATNLDNPNRKASAKAAWQGDRLVIQTTAEGPNGPIVTQATWYLEGDSLVRENKSTGPDGQEVVRKTFYKRAS